MYIVTGGAGFIGSNLVRGLNRNGIDDIIIVDDLENGEKHQGLNSLDFADFIDWRDLQGSWKVLLEEGAEAVFHQGACSDTMEANGRYMMEANYESSKETLHACLDTETPFFYASSASVYGDGERGFREDAACEAPLNVYAYSKFLFDQYVRRLLPGVESQVAGLRYFNVFGPQENHKGRMASVIFHFHKQIAEKGELNLFEGSEDFVRDFIHVDDVVAMNLWLLENPEVSGVYNCGTGQARSFLDLAKLVVEGTGGGAQIATVPFPATLEGKYQAYTCADLARLREVGCEHEFLTLEEGVTSYVERLNQTGGLYLRSE
jgi:ADP-L-glycero-D-manno-heptose 6-epimerase